MKKEIFNAVYFLVASSIGEVTVVALGPLTNLALAFKMDPSIVTHIGEIFVMGGNMQGNGNCVLGAEYNFMADAEAAYIVVHNVQCPMYIATWELCSTHSKMIDLVSSYFLSIYFSSESFREK